MSRMKGSRASSPKFRRIGIVAKTASATAVRLAASLERALKRRGRRVHQPDVESSLREDLGDAVAHRAGADHADVADLCHAIIVGAVREPPLRVT